MEGHPHSADPHCPSPILSEFGYAPLGAPCRYNLRWYTVRADVFFVFYVEVCDYRMQMEVIGFE